MTNMMMKTGKWSLNVALGFALALGVVSCRTASEDNAVKPQESSYLKTLRSLDWGTVSCFVYGHKTPDVDAVTSSLSYAKLMRVLGYNCKAKVSSEINR